MAAPVQRAISSVARLTHLSKAGLGFFPFWQGGGGGGGGSLGGGPLPCHPGARIPTPGSLQTICPSALTVIEPTVSQLPVSWLKE